MLGRLLNVFRNKDLKIGHKKIAFFLDLEALEN